MEKHIIKSSWEDGVHFKSDAPGGILNLDGAEDIGGQNKGFRPKALMLSALAGCTGIDVVMLLNKMRIPYSKVNIDVEADLSDEHPKMYKNVHVIYKIVTESMDEEKIHKAIDLSFEKYCGVIAMFKSFAEVTKEIQISAN